MTHELFHMDCRVAMDLFIEENSVDSIVTDPPYGLGFMGKAWDHGVPGVEFWQAAYRVLKPGGHLLAFSGSRTYHRMVCAIEDAGFEIRDQIMWVYGSGFPKSLNVSKAIDTGGRPEAIRRAAMGDEYQPSGRGRTNYDHGGASAMNGALSAPQPSDAARQWQGWGTALKPAFEPVVVARKANTAETERDTIDANLLTLEARLWSMLFALRADAPSLSSQNESNVALSIARWTAGDVINTLAALSDRMDMSQCESAINICLSIVSSWRRTWADLSKPGSTSTTTTESNTTTDSRTLSFCTSQITPLCIIPAVTQADGWPARAGNAARFFHAELLRLTATRERSALAYAIEQDRLRSLDADDKVKHEPIVVARKPLIGTVAANVLAHGTGAINVDGCRVENPDYNPNAVQRQRADSAGMNGIGQSGFAADHVQATYNAAGRWPANLIHDGSDEVVAAFPDAKGQQGDLKETGRARPSSGRFGDMAPPHPHLARNDTGSAARFFYCAKSSKSDRGEGNTHPTVKPTDLMRYLCRLVTPPGGVILDPFMGSGSTGKAALLEGFNFLGCETDDESFATAQRRIA